MSTSGPARAQDAEITGAAILKHPLGQLAIKSAELLHAGKINEAMQLRTKEDLADWKKSSAADQKNRSAMMRQRAPAPAAFTDAVRKDGVLTVSGNQARLRASFGDSGQVVASFEMEGGQWRAGLGPMVIEGAGNPANETRIQGADILTHPIGALALRYADAVHGGKPEELMRLMSVEGQTRWKSEPASERAESAAYRKKTTPVRASLLEGIKTGGILIIEDNARATLNVVRTENRSRTPGVVESTSTTTAIGFVLEGGEWKLAR